MKFSLCVSNNFVKLLLALISIGLIFQIGIFAQRGIGNVKVRDENGQEREVKLYDASYALVIGASNYNNGWRRLPGVKEDVAAVKESLLKQGFEVEELSDPTSDNFLPTINRFVNKYGLQPGNRLLIYFAGHGYTETASDGRKFGYIVPVDAPNPQKDLLSFQQQAVTMDDIESVARKIRSRHALFVFDSCFSGTLLNARRSNVPLFISNKVEKPVRQFISSGAADQEVPDVSIFRRQFVAALNGEADRNNDKFITGTELADFLQEKVTNYTRGSQTPQYGKIFDEALDKGDFVFAVPNKDALTPAQIVWNNFRGIAKKLTKYDSIYRFHDELAQVCLNDKCGFLNKSGDIAIDLKYKKGQRPGYFSEGLATLMIDGKYGFIDKTGKIAISPVYEKVTPFNDGLATAQLNGKQGYINKTGNIVIPIKYEFAISSFEGLLGVGLNEKAGFTDKTDKVVIPFEYDSINAFSEGLASVTVWEDYEKPHCQYINKSGQVVLDTFNIYNSCERFSEGLAAVGIIERYDEKEEETIWKWGFIDNAGKKITELIYDKYGDFEKGLAAVVKDKKLGFIDKNGNEVISLKYDDDEIIIYDELVRVSLNKKIGFLDHKGNVIIPFKYDSIWCHAFIKEGFIGVTFNGKKGFVDIYGNEYFDF